MAKVEGGAPWDDKLNENSMILTQIYSKLSNALKTSEDNLTATLDKLNNADDITQAELLNIQTKIQAWGNVCSTITGLMRAVGDSLKSTTQNIR